MQACATGATGVVDGATGVVDGATGTDAILEAIAALGKAAVDMESMYGSEHWACRVVRREKEKAEALHKDGMPNGQNGHNPRENGTDEGSGEPNAKKQKIGSD